MSIRKQTDRVDAMEVSVFLPSPKRLKEVDAFLADKTSAFARLPPARVTLDAPSKARRVLPW